MGCLYKLTSPSNKSYIGITMKTADQRWSKHIEHALGKRDNGALYSALRKYGPSNFSLTVLVTSDDWNALCELEKRIIHEHNTLSPNGYNIALGGEGVQGKRSEADRLKISAAQKKRCSTPEGHARMVELSRRSRLSPKWHEAQARKRKPVKPAKPKMSREERSERIRAGMNSPEALSKMRSSLKARWSSPEFRARFSASRTGKKHRPCSLERKRKISEARKREWADPIMRAKRLALLPKAREPLRISRESKITA
jgi:group I intron endonuclease